MCCCISLTIVIALTVLVLAGIGSFTFLRFIELRFKIRKQELENESNKKEHAEIFNVQVDAYRKMFDLLCKENKQKELKALAEDMQKLLQN